MKVVLATANLHKAEEIRRVLAPFDVELVERPRDVAEVDEPEATLEGNALIKARAICAATNLAALADDTGLFVAALGGRPGVHSARFAGPRATGPMNVAKLLDELNAVGAPSRGASFRTVVAVARPDGAQWWVQGSLEGEITTRTHGDGGFGYDCVFAPLGLGGRTLAELRPDEKNELSHRGVALRRIAATLASS